MWAAAAASVWTLYRSVYTDTAFSVQRSPTRGHGCFLFEVPPAADVDVIKRWRHMICFGGTCDVTLETLCRLVQHQSIPSGSWCWIDCTDMVLLESLMSAVLSSWEPLASQLDKTEPHFTGRYTCIGYFTFFLYSVCMAFGWALCRRAVLHSYWLMHVRGLRLPSYIYSV